MVSQAWATAAALCSSHVASTLLPCGGIASHSNKEVRPMKRILSATAPFLAAALMLAGPAAAANKVTCKQVKEQLAAGKSPADVEKELKISKKMVDHCSAKKVASTKKHGSSSAQGGTTAH